jgi:putative nucleotidyltransferase with HDIG domain
MEHRIEDKILLVDDEPSIIHSLKRTLRGNGRKFFEAHNGKDGLRILDDHYVDLIITDCKMPEMDGIEFLEHVRSRDLDAFKIMLTAFSDSITVMDAVNKGEVYRFVVKPWNPDEMKSAVKEALEKHRALKDFKHLFDSHQKQNKLLSDKNINLEESVKKYLSIAQEKELQIQDAYWEAVQSLAEALEARDPYTRRHSEFVAKYSVIIARSMGLSAEVVETIRQAALLHDIGKIGIRESIFLKEGPLTPDERAIMETHSTISAQILSPLKFLAEIIPVVRHHHERYDGKGYPDGLEGQDIPSGSRIIAVADTFEAMTADRPYRKALPVSAALGELKRVSGTQLDPKVVAAFLQISEDIEGLGD